MPEGGRPGHALAADARRVERRQVVVLGHVVPVPGEHADGRVGNPDGQQRSRRRARGSTRGPCGASARRSAPAFWPALPKLVSSSVLAAWCVIVTARAPAALCERGGARMRCPRTYSSYSQDAASGARFQDVRLATLPFRRYPRTLVSRFTFQSGPDRQIDPVRPPPGSGSEGVLRNATWSSSRFSATTSCGRHVRDTGQRQHRVRVAGREQRRGQPQRVRDEHVVVGQPVDDEQRADRSSHRTFRIIIERTDLVGGGICCRVTQVALGVVRVVQPPVGDRRAGDRRRGRRRGGAAPRAPTGTRRTTSRGSRPGSRPGRRTSPPPRAAR